MGERLHYTWGSDEVTMWVTAHTERTDYGVPNSPVWYEIDWDTLEIEEIWFINKSYTEQEFIRLLGKPAVYTIMNMIIDEIPSDPSEWEN